VATGGNHGCAIIAGGAVVCWGSNSSGELGNNSKVSSLVPVPVTGLSSGVTAVSGNSKGSTDGVSCAVTAGGAVVCWGTDGHGGGLLGNNSATDDSPVPVPVMGISSGATAVSVGKLLSCALTAGGGVMCWGDNSHGQLGNNSTVGSPVPVPVMGLSSGVTAVSVGDFFVCAIVAGGGVVCWGDNSFGQLGNDSTDNSLVPVPVKGLSAGCKAVSTGGGNLGHACGVTAGGAVVCWGDNRWGQLGNNSTTASHVPVPVVGLP
jgi:alpha-tubulin suppressor-like RCC1 family protein